MSNFSLYAAFKALWNNVLLALDELTETLTPTEITTDEIDEICGSSIYAVEEHLF